jgi:hypothetical protein
MSEQNNNLKYWILTFVIGVVASVVSYQINCGGFSFHSVNAEPNTDSNGFYILNVAAVKTESEAKAKAEDLKKEGCRRRRLLDIELRPTTYSVLPYFVLWWVKPRPPYLQKAGRVFGSVRGELRS